MVKIARKTAVAISLLASAVLSPAALADDEALAAEQKAAGQKIFSFRCAACHTLSADDTSTAAFGPHLEGIVGRQAGSVEGYDYEFDLMREQAFAWDEERLEAWLEKPQEMVPGMCLPYFGLRRTGDRAALMTYMQATD